MKVVIAGGSGFLGRALSSALVARGHEVVVLSRGRRDQSSAVRFAWWSPEESMPAAEYVGWTQEIDGADAVVNLSGESIDGRRWTEHRKEKLRQSRIISTRNLISAVRAAKRKPSVFVGASGVGYYGTPVDETLDESFPPGSDFLATLCLEWEANANAAAALGCRVVVIRSGIVLSSGGGALKRMIPPFKFYVGGRIASGKQYMSWIHLDDWVGIAVWALEHQTVTGAINATAPAPVTNAEFAKALGSALGRPSWLPVPAFALRLIIGEMAPVALVRGQRVLPKRAIELGYSFKYTDLDAAMKAAVPNGPRV